MGARAPETRGPRGRRPPAGWWYPRCRLLQACECEQGVLWGALSLRSAADQASRPLWREILGRFEVRKINRDEVKYTPGLSALLLGPVRFHLLSCLPPDYSLPRAVLSLYEAEVQGGGAGWRDIAAGTSPGGAAGLIPLNPAEAHMTSAKSSEPRGLGVPSVETTTAPGHLPLSTRQLALGRCLLTEAG